ncbi:MAG: hypothetical protein MAG715_00664 [Methanonatronarchaeales archaeon]|nr:hypothetical protein [Methanonatronarchaeales archaeon]
MPIRVALAGVGNCASSLVQGVEFYGECGDAPGLIHADFGGYGIGDIEFVAAFDVDARKVGRDLSEAVFEEPNCTTRFSDVPETGVEVRLAPVMDGVGRSLSTEVRVGGDEPVDVSRVLQESGAEVLVNFLPVGSSEATAFYAGASLEAGAAFVNCIPEFIASEPAWASRFEDAGLPVLGDDVKSQFGATMLHRAVVQTMRDRGVRVENTYQLNVGGNTDFKNMLDEERNRTKRVSKTEAITSLLDDEIGVRIGPSDYVEFLDDNKQAFMQVEGRKFGETPVSVDMKLSVEDSPNSAGVVAEAIRAAKLGLDRGISGPIESVSAYLFKHPPARMDDDDARKLVESFIKGDL